MSSVIWCSVFVFVLVVLIVTILALLYVSKKGLPNNITKNLDDKVKPNKYYKPYSKHSASAVDDEDEVDDMDCIISAVEDEDF